MSGGEWKDVSREHPCPVCEKPDWCTITADGGTIHCRRGQNLPAPPGYRLARRQPTDAARFVRDRGADALAYDPVVYRPAVRVPKASPPPARDWPALAGECEAAAGDHVERLAADLGVSVEAVRALGVGWNGRAWTIQNRDATGTAIGLATRLPDGDKKYTRGSRQGLVYAPDSWAQGDGPVLLVEGMSDTAALYGLGLAVIGRPSNTGGADLLIEMLATWPEDRGIVVVGERDEKSDGSWPGRDGAIRTAERLADQLHRDIAWTLPPEPFKDSRAFVRSGADAETVTFEYAAAAQVIRGTPRAPHEDATTDTTAPRDLAGYRDELRDSKLWAVMSAGLRVDRAPTGAGKTRSTTEALRHVGKKIYSVTCLPTHANIRERAAEMLAAGHKPQQVGVMPELTADNCVLFEEATAAREAGMSHGLTICPSCDHRKGCEYARLASLAKGRKHLLTTAEHYRRSWTTEGMKKRRIVIVDEKPDETLAPMIECTVADIQALAEFLDAIVTAGNARALRTLAESADDPSPAADAAVEAAQVADHLALIARAAIDLAEGMAEPGIAFRSIEHLGEMGDGWERRMVAILARTGSTPPPPEAMRLVVALASGVTDTVWASADRLPNGGLKVFVFVHWRVDLDGRAVVLLDGTADIGQLGKLAGAAVEDITPAGRLENVHAVTQRPIPIAMSTPAGRVATIVTAVLDDLEDYPRVGLIGHKKTVASLMGEGDDALPPAARERIVKSSWFGHGPDRASNEWHGECDVLLVVGTPRPNPGSIRRRLVVQGDIEAAGLPDGTWDDGTWDATTTDGEVVTLVSRGYTNPDWRAAHQAIVRAALRQAIGRARAGLPEGIPAVVLSDEPLGLPIDRRPVLVRRAHSQRVLDAMRLIQAAAEAASLRKEAEFEVETLAGGACAKNKAPLRIRYMKGDKLLIECGADFLAQPAAPDSGGLRVALPRGAVLTAADVSSQRLSQATSDLVASGDIHQPEPGYWALGAAPTDEATVYTRILPAGREEGATGLGRPPEVEARAAEARATVAAVAATTRDGIVTTGQFVAAAAQEARRTALRKLAEAVAAGTIERLDRGRFAPDLPVSSVTHDGKAATAWTRDSDGAKVVIRVEMVGGGAVFFQPPPRPPAT